MQYVEYERSLLIPHLHTCKNKHNNGKLKLNSLRIKQTYLEAFQTRLHAIVQGDQNMNRDQDHSANTSCQE